MEINYDSITIHYALLAEGQDILHHCMRLLHGAHIRQYGPLLIKYERVNAFYVRLTLSINRIPVFVGEYHTFYMDTVTFPNTTYIADNTYNLKTNRVTVYREGRWRQEITKEESNTPDSPPNSFEPFDDSTLW